MYKLYIANKNYSSWSLRPWLLLRELAIPFEEISVRFESTDNWSAFRKFSPTGRVPCLVDGSTTVWDSLAITEYLAERHPTVWPQDTRIRAWARCATAEMHSGFGVLRDKCSMSCGIRIRLHEQGAGLKKDIARIDEVWNEGLQKFGGPYLAGPAFTAVDAFYAPVAFRVQTYGLPLSEKAAGYAARLLGLPAARSWYQAALAENFRDPAHEQEILASGVVTEDLRA